MNRRSGFTLPELLVVIAIIGVLVSIAFPAMQKVRTAAARVQCANNLRQLAIASQQCHESQGRFPAGMRYNHGKDPYPFMSWLTQLLPFVERNDLWTMSVAAYEQTRDPSQNPPHVGLSTIVPAFVCPSDPRSAQTQIATGVQTPVAFTCYLGVEGRDLFAQDGMYFVDSHVRLADVRDGTSQTLLIGERPPSTDFEFGWWYMGVGQQVTGSADMVLGVEEQNVLPYFKAPCSSGVYEYGPGQISEQCDMFHFWSLHTGGANFAFVDGSVRFLSYSAAPLMPALASRAGGEAVETP
jgi:prepilin-type N-terminal cleavage/methylation domain-containing protein/prepilin-type processing-associated H-X9-DG protein